MKSTVKNRRSKLIRIAVVGLLTVLIGAGCRQATSSSQGAKPVEDHPPVTLDRYPTMECPDQVRAQQEFTVQISLTTDLVTPEAKIQSGARTGDGKLALSLPDAGEPSWVIQVVLAANDFTPGGGVNTSTIELPRDGDSSPAVFYLRAKPFQGTTKQSKLYATFWHNNTYLARVFREVTIVDDRGTDKQVRDISPSVIKQRLHPLGSDLNSETPADLTVYIQGSTMQIGGRGRIPHLFNYSIPRRDPQDPNSLSNWLTQQYRSFAQLGARSTEPITDQSSVPNKVRASDLLRDFGRQLYKNFAPPDFKEAFWALADKYGSEFKTIQIYTDDPLLPWELMRPFRHNEEREALGVEFSVGRWHVSEQGTQLDKPPPSLRIDDLVVVAPEYQGRLALPAQTEELQALSTFQGFRRLPGQLEEIRRLAADMPQGMVHFAGHGVVSSARDQIPEYSIELEDGRLDLMTWRSIMPLQTRNHPFFFFNACDVGQSQKIANFVDGWAPAVLDSGASGYIGALWPLGDRSAAEFAGQFYRTLEESLKTGPTAVADVLRQTRRMFLDNGDPTFLAYVYYGDPNLKFVARSQE